MRMIPTRIACLSIVIDIDVFVALTGALFLCLNCAPRAYGSTLTESSTCSIDITGGSVTTQGGNTSCSLGSPNAAGYVAGTIGFSASYDSLSGQIMGEAIGAPTDNSSSSAGFIGSITYIGSLNYTDELTTSGSVRSGYLDYSVSLLGSPPYSGNITGSVVVGNYVGFSSAGYPGAASSAVVPVTLGIPFALTLNESLEALAAPIDGVVGGTMRASLTYSFVEADGTTPVAVSEYFAPVDPPASPEPSTIMLFVPPFIGVLAAYSRR